MRFAIALAGSIVVDSIKTIDQYPGKLELTAIKRGDELMISPGPYAVLTEGDVCYFITAELSDHRVREYLYGEKNPVTR